MTAGEGMSLLGGKKKGEERVTEGEYLKLSPVCPYHSHKSQVSHQFKMWMNRHLSTEIKFGETNQDR